MASATVMEQKGTKDITVKAVTNRKRKGDGDQRMGWKREINCKGGRGQGIADLVYSLCQCHP